MTNKKGRRKMIDKPQSVPEKKLFSNQLKSGSRLSKVHLAIVGLVFALIGGFFLYNSFAASNLAASLEAEQMNLPTGGKVLSDVAASGGKAIVLLANGTASGSIKFPSTVSSLTVRAKGQQCSGAPLMTVNIDGKALLNNTAVSSTSWTSYSVTPATALSSGTHSVTASLTNYYKNPNICARTLYLDVFYFFGTSTSPAPSPTVSLSATPTSVAVGSPSTLTWSSTNATGCTASGAWSGAQSLSGSVSTGAINQSSTYTLTCSGTGGTATGSVTVSVISTGKVWNITPTSTPSLATAEQQAQPGDTILLSGSFKNVSLVPGVSGTATAPITYKAASSGVTFDAAGMTSTLVAITGRSYLVFDGLGFTNSNYINAPVTNRGVILRSSQYITFKNSNFSYMQMELIGSSYNSIINNTWRYFVASYVKDANGVLQPQTAGDMLYIVANSSTQVGSTHNTIQYNNMQYAGHSLIEVGNGFGWGANTYNQISNNTLSNPWYRCIALADDGTGTVVDSNQLLDSNSVPTLYSTVAGKVGQLNTASNAIQIIGQNFTVSNNTIKNSVAAYGVINLIAEYYTQNSVTYLDEAKNNKIFGNTITGNKGAAAVGFVVYRASTDPAATPNLTGNDVHDNTITGNTTSTSSQQGVSGYNTFLYHAAAYATAWVGLNGNLVHANQIDASTNAYVTDYAYNGTPSVYYHKVYDLTQFQSLDSSHVYGNY